LMKYGKRALRPSFCLGRVDKPGSQISQVLIQGSFWRSCRDPWIDERSGMVLS
jgi:hypothetical protein